MDARVRLPCGTAGFAGFEEEEMKDLNQRKKRLRLVLAAALAIGCSSATMSGTLAMLGAGDAPSAQIA